MSKRVEDILAKLVSFDTTSCKSNRACVDFIRDYLDGFGVTSETVTDKSGRKVCLWATIGNRDARGIAIAAHTDVVPADEQIWTSDPFKLTERDGKWFGRGTVDMKGFLACVLAVVPEFLAARTGKCFHLALTSDEETDMSGVARLIHFLEKRDIKPEWIWLGEPTDFAIVDEHKGCATYQTRFTGVSGHSSQPDKGLSAIDLAAQTIVAIADVQQKRKQSPFLSSRFDPPYTTSNLGMIRGGTAENIIAEHCEILWQVRAHPGDCAADFLADVEKSIAESVSPEIGDARAKIETQILYDILPFKTGSCNKGTQALKRALKTDKTSAAPFAAEAGIYQKVAEVVVCGPGSVEQAHQPNEFIDKTLILSCVDLIGQVLLSSSAPLAA